MKKFFIYFLIFSFTFCNLNILNASETHILDFTKVLNQSQAGKEAQDFLKNKLDKEIKKFNDIEKNLRDEEKKLIEQKKIITQEEYQKKVDELRNKVAKLQKDRQNSLSSVAKTRAEARKKLLDNLNPILEAYMKENNIKLILDKQVILISEKDLEITDKIISILNNKLKSLNLK